MQNKFAEKYDNFDKSRSARGRWEEEKEDSSDQVPPDTIHLPAYSPAYQEVSFQENRYCWNAQTCQFVPKSRGKVKEAEEKNKLNCAIESHRGANWGESFGRSHFEQLLIYYIIYID